MDTHFGDTSNSISLLYDKFLIANKNSKSSTPYHSEDHSCTLYGGAYGSSQIKPANEKNQNHSQPASFYMYRYPSKSKETYRPNYNGTNQSKESES